MDKIMEELAKIPESARLSALVLSVMDGHAGPINPISAIIHIVTIMARHLSPNDRQQIADQLRMEARFLDQELN